MSTVQKTRWVAGLAAVLLLAGSALAQRTRGERPPMSATGIPLSAGERGSSVTGPTLGYAVDASTGTLHMVSGIAGSSLMGDPVHRGGSIVLSAVSPEGNYAVIADDAGSVMFYGAPTPRGADSVALSAPGDALSHLAVSPSGDHFVLFSAESRRFALYSVEGGSVAAERSLLEAPSLTGEIRRVAVADGGKMLAVIAHDASGARVLRIRPDGSVSLAAALPGPVDLAFFANSEKAVIVDSVQNALYEADLAQGTPSLRLVASQAEGIDGPSAVALSADGRVAAVASVANRRAILVDLQSANALAMDLPEAPTALRRMNGRAVFQLTDASSAPMLLLDAQGDQPRTVYVPRAQASRSASAGRAGIR